METVTLELFPNSEPTVLDKSKTRVLLVAQNLSGYYSLPIRTLCLLINVSKKLSKHFDTRFTETVVDENSEYLLGVIDTWRPDIIGLSVNIWNRNNCIQLAKEIKYRYPDTVILAGGQEVTGSVIDYLDYVPEFDYIIDAIDTVSSKLLLVEIAHKVGVPIISSMGAGNKLDPTRFEVTDISKTSVCPLAKVMRKELKVRGIPKLKVVYSKEPAMKPIEKDELSCKSNCICPKDVQRNCSSRRQVPGSIAFVPSVVGLIIAGEVIKDLIK